ncbi:MAG TPA: hypothetical protein VGL34_03160 [Steroidobacteraceae bacterium]|jgi:hypothetical protein
MNPVIAWIVTGLILLVMLAIPAKAYRTLLLVIAFPILFMLLLVFL